MDRFAQVYGKPPRARVHAREEESLVFPPVNGRVAAGVWLDLELVDDVADERPKSILPVDPRYPARCQYDLVVDGNSINRFARAGAFLRCVEIVCAGVELRDGDYVIVKRTTRGMIETTAKRLRIKGDTTALWPDSDDPRYQEPLTLPKGGADGDLEVAIVGLVLWQFGLSR